ncbi:MAG: Gfo/Idh/MocA family oxidoreductase [Thermoanaerobaculia bacterium]
MTTRGAGRATGAPEPVRIGVFGTGALGRHHTRILAELPGADLVGVYDPREDQARAAAEPYGARVFPSAEELAGTVEAAVAAVPTVAHADVGCELLGRGLHVLVEKPLAPSLAEADRLLQAAEDAGAVLAVGHVEFFNPAVKALLGALPAAEPVSGGGGPRFVEVQRLARFTPRSLDVDVVLDLMIHDLQILHALDPTPVTEVRATGIDVLSPRIDIANVRLELGSGCVANLTASRVSSDRVRKLRVFASSRYFSVDYQDQEVKGYRLEEDGGGEREIRRTDLRVERAEPLRRELEAFLAACRGERTRIVTGSEGRRALDTALRVVEAIG